MIYIYPLLTSKTVDPKLLSGVCKVLERFIIVNELNDILSNTTLNYAKNIGKQTGQMIGQAIVNKGFDKVINAIGNSDKLLNKLPGMSRFEGKNKNIKNRQKLYEAFSDDEINTFKNQIGYKQGLQFGQHVPAGQGISINVTPPEDKPHEKWVSTDIDVKNINTLSLEPTWMTVTNKSGDPSLVGIKVVPYIISSDHQIIDVITNDIETKKVEALIRSLYRKVITSLWLIYRHTIGKLPLLGKEISGSPSDIIHGQSEYGRRVFLFLNSNDIPDIMLKPVVLNKLFQMGWNSVIFSDETDKMVSFCLKQFKGLCSKVHASYIYTNFGREGHQAFKDLYDVKKSISPFM